MVEALDGLSDENTRAWRLFHTCASRFMGETRATGAIIARLTADLDAEDFEDMMRRLSLIYDIHNPPKRERADGS